jgi:hypothetical protein
MQSLMKSPLKSAVAVVHWLLLASLGYLKGEPTLSGGGT